MKKPKNLKKFYVLNWDFNSDNVYYYDVLPYLRNRLEERIEKHREDKDKYLKAPKSFNEFKRFVEDESLYQFWSRCEYEMIVHGWPVKRNDYKIDVHEQIMMNIDVISGILFDEYWDKIDKEAFNDMHLINIKNKE